MVSCNSNSDHDNGNNNCKESKIQQKHREQPPINRTTNKLNFQVKQTEQQNLSSCKFKCENARAACPLKAKLQRYWKKERIKIVFSFCFKLHMCCCCCFCFFFKSHQQQVWLATVAFVACCNTHCCFYCKHHAHKLCACGNIHVETVNLNIFCIFNFFFHFLFCCILTNICRSFVCSMLLLFAFLRSLLTKFLWLPWVHPTNLQAHIHTYMYGCTRRGNKGVCMHTCMCMCVYICCKPVEKFSHTLLYLL